MKRAGVSLRINEAEDKSPNAKKEKVRIVLEM